MVAVMNFKIWRMSLIGCSVSVCYLSFFVDGGPTKIETQLLRFLVLFLADFFSKADFNCVQFNFKTKNMLLCYLLNSHFLCLLTICQTK